MKLPAAIVQSLAAGCIYIPLRSDETKEAAGNVGSDRAFISHYVQMKPGQCTTRSARWRHLYPTTFRWNFLPQSFNLLPLAVFISHYVQMKHGKYEVRIEKLEHLYPTTFRWNMTERELTCWLLHNLYPTTFRWNADSSFFVFLGNMKFISHYVQMKPRSHLQSRPSGGDGIYIPLRSDETIQTVAAHFDGEEIYIPLRSDETRFCLATLAVLLHIYIPLRSDETKSTLLRMICAFIFISHYVQMKPGMLNDMRYSLEIYIPLRSDETRRQKIIERVRNIFISHYVQMKPASEWRSYPRPLNLYPTTFRWNVPLQCYVSVFHAFISHYVQMKPSRSSWRWDGCWYLYPTTFRWNNPFGGFDFPNWRIYIPLRSDETRHLWRPRWKTI